MKRLRLTREQSKHQTRQRLLDAAQVAFMEKGFVGASVENIADAAGYTRGAFYSNFRNKPALFLELLRRDHESMQAGLRDIFEQAATRENMEVRLLHYYSNLHRENKCFLLWTDAKLLAVRDVRWRVLFNALLQEKLEESSAYIREFSERAGTPLPLSAKVLAMGLMGLCDGVQLLCAIDPQNAMADVAESILTGFLARVLYGRDVG